MATNGCFTGPLPGSEESVDIGLFEAVGVKPDLLRKEKIVIRKSQIVNRQGTPV